MKPTLVVLAAGLGSRYGSLKQMDGVGPSGETIIDYTIFDAIKAGYGKVVFVIRKSMEKDFKETLLARISDRIRVECVFQELDILPEGCSVPEGREKPWGTAHAVWMACSVITEPFAMVNADDFYGRESLGILCKHLEKLNNDEAEASLVGYPLKNTLSEHGSVSRGICETDEQSNLIGIEERTQIATNENGMVYFEKNGTRYRLTGNEIVSMNLIGFTSQVFKLIEEGFKKFYREEGTSLSAEYYIPEVLKTMIGMGDKVPVLSTSSQWFGITYKEDKPVVQQKLEILVTKGVYPRNLWE